MSRLRAAVLGLAALAALAGCGSGDGTAGGDAAPSSTSDPFATPEVPEPTTSPGQQWFADGGEAASQAVIAADGVSLTEGVDQAAAQCGTLADAVTAAQALPDYPSAAEEAALAQALTALATGAQECLTAAAAGDAAGLAGAVYGGVSPAGLDFVTAYGRALLQANQG